jgi:ATP-dependent exoDNAse (exonuclease V) alpha subunit
MQSCARTVQAYHGAPRGVRMFSRLSSRAIARRPLPCAFHTAMRSSTCGAGFRCALAALASFSEAGTVHSALFRLKNGRDAWDRRTVLVVDEAAMLDARITGEVLSAARKAGAKVILAGDDRQLAAIERGGLFSEMRGRHGAAEIAEVTRQRVGWQRQAARDLAAGRFAAAIEAFDAAGAITWTGNQDEARAALVAAWKRATEADRP